MSYKHILRRNLRKDEKIFLMVLEGTNLEDDFGFTRKGFVEKQELHGVIQRPQEEEISNKGEESNPDYVGYFLPEFIIKQDEVADYRIKYERPHETLLMKIINYNPNLFLKGKRDHIQLELLLEKKSEGGVLDGW